MSYASEQYKEYTKQLRESILELPKFCAEFFRGIENDTLVRTRVAYAGDLKLFFNFIVKEIDCFIDKSVKDIEISDLDKLTSTDIEIYLAHITMYTDNDENEIVNNNNAKARKLSAIRSLYKYFCRKGKLINNPAGLVATPAIREKAIIRLEPNEVAVLLDAVQSGAGLSKKQKTYHQHTQLRDLAILTLFLGTGIRISELVGLNIDDINFSANEFSIIRKGGNQDILVFGDEARDALLQYMLQREKMLAHEDHEQALFLSIQRKRLTIRAVENLVKKYASIAVPFKKITPHKLRSTYGTALYRETGDIYLVADVLGHKDVNTTRKHYAAASVEKRRLAAKVIKLRDDD